MTAALDPDRLLVELIREGQRFTGLAAAGLAQRPDRSVPGCPGWSLADLVAHTAGVYDLVVRWVSDGVRPPPGGAPDAAAPRALSQRLTDRCHALMDLLTDLPADAPCPTWCAYDTSATFWRRRMLQETAVHRVDLAQALGRPWDLEADVARDGVDEALTLWLGTRVGSDVRGSGRAVHVRVLADPGPRAGPGPGPHAGAGAGNESGRYDRVVRPLASRVEFTSRRDDVPVDAVLTGTARAVWAWAWGRADASTTVDVEGDPDAVTELREVLARAQV